MRYICKTDAPKKFLDWKALANDEWQPCYDNLSGEVKEAVYESLLREQGYICCYCERELIAKDYHLEHLNPQSVHAGDDVDYSNFLCSCLNKTTKGDPLHCGKLKGDDIIEVHPLQMNCVSNFEFNAQGEIKGRTDEATRTIETLGLNIKKLIDMRKTALEPFLDESIEGDDFLEFVEKYLLPTKLGRINPFHSMVACVVGGK